MAFKKHPQFLSNQADILPIFHTHELVILTKFGNDHTKIMDFSLLAYFSGSSIFPHNACIDEIHILVWNMFYIESMYIGMNLY